MLLAALTALVMPFAVLPPAAPGDDVAHFTFMPKDGKSEVRSYRPQRVELSADKPATIVKVPADLAAPMYGAIPVGDGAGTALVLDEPAGKPARLFVDTNRNGDLTDDPACAWTGTDSKSESGATLTMYAGSATLDLGEAGKPLHAAINCYRFDRNDPKRAAMKDTLFYYRDYVSKGTVVLGDRTCKALLDDEVTGGDFRGKADAGTAGSGVSLLLDVNGNGVFDTRGERFDVRQPFNVGGTTWELADVARDGTSFKVVKSGQTVAEVATPPDHSVGRTITAFEAKDTAGNAVNFPADYAGKIVLLDFWATWCGPCMHEMPNVVETYGKLHAQGFEIQGISLDDGKTLPGIKDVMAKQGMVWRQVADGKGWKADIAQRFAIDSIPATFLVDGTTGTILGADLRGEALAAAVEKALAARKAP